MRARDLPHLFLLAVLAAPLPAAPAPRPLVVEAVAPGSEAERAGLRAGDLLLGWEQGAAQGRLATPFHVSALELERTPRGPITLAGRRGDQAQRWTLGP